MGQRTFKDPYMQQKSYPSSPAVQSTPAPRQEQQLPIKCSWNKGIMHICRKSLCEVQVPLDSFCDLLITALCCCCRFGVLFVCFLEVYTGSTKAKLEPERRKSSKVQKIIAKSDRLIIWFWQQGESPVEEIVSTSCQIPIGYILRWFSMYS